jgi:iron complex outermembrane receptor protein
MFPKSQGLNRLFRWTATKLGTALLIAASCSAANAETASAEASSADTALEEVVVTAQKREQNLQDVPIAVSVLTDSTLQAVRFVNVEDLNAVATGLTVVNTEGGTQEPVFSMRGIFGAATFASDPGIALYVDGVYLPAAVGAAFDLADINQIEVLRGPQGTLFGRNAIAGAINLITKEPTGKFDARQELTYGNFDQFRSKSHIDLPAWGPLSASLTYLHNERHGDTRNLGAGTVWDFSTATNGAIGKLTSPERLGDQDIDAVSAALKLELSGGGKLVGCNG